MPLLALCRQLVSDLRQKNCAVGLRVHEPDFLQPRQVHDPRLAQRKRQVGNRLDVILRRLQRAVTARIQVQRIRFCQLGQGIASVQRHRRRVRQPCLQTASRFRCESDDGLVR